MRLETSSKNRYLYGEFSRLMEKEERLRGWNRIWI